MPYESQETEAGDMSPKPQDHRLGDDGVIRTSHGLAPKPGGF